MSIPDRILAIDPDNHAWNARNYARDCIFLPRWPRNSRIGAILRMRRRILPTPFDQEIRPKNRYRRTEESRDSGNYANFIIFGAPNYQTGVHDPRTMHFNPMATYGWRL